MGRGCDTAPREAFAGCWLTGYGMEGGGGEGRASFDCCGTKTRYFRVQWNTISGAVLKGNGLCCLPCSLVLGRRDKTRGNGRGVSCRCYVAVSPCVFDLVNNYELARLP